MITDVFQNAAVLILACVMYGLYGVFIRLSKHGAETAPYNLASTFVLSEVFKLFASLVLLIREKGAKEALSKLRSISSYELFLFVLPGSFYAVTNSLDFYILRHMDPGSFQVLSQSKIITTAVVWLIVFNKSLSSLKWVSLVLLMIGSSFIAYPKSEADASQMYVLPAGLVFLLAQITLSAFAGVFNEFIYKREAFQTFSIHRLNVSMYIWGVIFQTSNYWSNSSGGGFFDGFNGYAWIVAVIYATKGLLISQIFKYYSVIVKLLVNGFSIFIANFFTWYFFGLTVGTSHQIGLSIVFFALVLYNYKDISDYQKSKTVYSSVPTNSAAFVKELE